MPSIHLQVIQSIIDNYIAAKNGEIHVLDVGCGSSTRFKFPHAVKITGIDISCEQLLRNTVLAERILGDIQTYSTDKRYDIVICWTVLEHIKNLRKALSNLLTWTKQNGIIIIDVPNVFSLKGLITKFTPYWFHRWAHKNIFHGTGTRFYTYLRFSISPNSLVNYFSGNEIEYKGFAAVTLSKHYLCRVFFIALKILKVLTLGKYHPELSEFYLVIRKTIR